MKKLYFLVIALCCFTATKAQIVTIPDANFKGKLLASESANTIAKDLKGNYFRIDSNYNKQIELTEALQVSYLNIGNSTISSLQGILSFTNLQNLTCGGNQLSTLDVSSLTNLQSLTCDSNQLSTLDVRGLTNLNALTCSYNQLSSLNVTGLINLKTLLCRNNKLTSLNLTGLSSLISLSYRNNLLPNVDLTGHSNLEQLYCSGNKITSLDFTTLPNLTTLYCDNNLFEALNINGLINLKELYCNDNKLVDLDLTILSNLFSLVCGNNLLKNLNVRGLKKLETLSFANNDISNIDLNGVTNLIYFNCSNNKLTTLDFSELNDEITTPQSITYGCSENGVVIYPSTRLFDLNNNQLTIINLKTSYLYCVEFSNNPNLQYICANDDQIKRFENLINSYGYTNCHVNTYCSFVPGGTFYTIQGSQKLDNNANGCDALDAAASNLKFSITDGTATGSLISNSTGNYSIPVQAGTHTITPVFENPAYYNVSPTTATVTFPTQTSPFTQNFCVTANGTHPDLEITLLPLQPARPGFDSKYKIIYKNKGNTTQSGSVNLTFDDAVLDLVVANPVTSTQITNNLSWNFTNLLPFETREIELTLNVNSPMETPAVIGGSVLPYIATITSAATDETPIDNTFDFNQTVVNSFDPNDKTCLEGTTISPSLIGQYVHYMIRFENTGTFPAQNIVVKDMIDLTKFDITTLVPTNASHSYITKISAGNKVEFIFENVNLPFDDANNDGYIAFKIKTLPTLAVNDTFANEASIFFDYNFPIVTNKATATFKTLGIPDFEFSNYFTLYPNPAKSVLNISSKEAIEVKSISIYNTLGQLVLVVTNAEKVSKIDVSSLTTGNYFIKINSDKGTSNTRFIKE